MPYRGGLCNYLSIVTFLGMYQILNFTCGPNLASGSLIIISKTTFGYSRLRKFVCQSEILGLCGEFSCSNQSTGQLIYQISNGDARFTTTTQGPLCLILGDVETDKKFNPRRVAVASITQIFASLTRQPGVVIMSNRFFWKGIWLVL